MKKKYLILFIISLYLMQIPLFIDFIIINSENYNEILENILFNTSLAFLIISTILGLVNLIIAFTNKQDNVIKTTMISKLILIPLFILFTFMTMIVTSSYNISYLISKFKHKEINIIVFIMHFILQCVFICDIIDTIYIYKTGENMIK